MAEVRPASRTTPAPAPEDNKHISSSGGNKPKLVGCFGCLPWRKSESIAPGLDPRDVRPTSGNTIPSKQRSSPNEVTQQNNQATERVRAEDLAGASIRGTNQRKIMSLSKSGKLDLLREHLDSHPEDLNTRGMWGNTALIYACANRRESAALELLRRGANVTHFNEDGCTALHHACMEGLEDFVRALARDLHERPPENMANLFKPSLMYNIKADRKQHMRPLAAASVNEHVSIVDLLLSEPAFSGAADVAALEAAFRQAIMSTAPRSASLLLSKCRAELIPMVKSDVSLLTQACRKGALSMIKLLLDAGSEVNACLCDRSAEIRAALGCEGPLAVACETGESDLVLDLLAAGADPNYTCGACSLPLTHACRAGEVDCVSRLIEAGAHANIPDPSTGLSPMQFVQNAAMTEMGEIMHGI